MTDRPTNKCVILHASIWDPVRRLSDQKLGRLMRMCIDYVESDGKLESDVPEWMAFEWAVMKERMDLGMNKYRDKVHRAEAARVQREERRRTREGDS